MFNEMVECYLALDCKANGRGREHDLNFIRVPASHLAAARQRRLQRRHPKNWWIKSDQRVSSYILHKSTVHSQHGRRDTTTRENLLLAQVPIFESEVALLAHAPASLPVKVQVLPLLVFFRDLIRLGVPLEPGQEFDMEPPRLFLQLLRCEPPEIDVNKVTIMRRTRTAGKSLAYNRKPRIASRGPAVRRIQAST